ncbi:MAG: T9SS type A sorting domain-containing protein [Bacteroidota bacterium]
MKKVLLVFISLISFSSTRAQYVNIPDSAFRAWLMNNGYASCMSGNSLDISCPSVLSATDINCNHYNIQNLTGVEYFTNLNYLNCLHNQLTSLPILPTSLTTLICGENQFSVIGNLPSSLSIFSCTYNQLTSLPNLPSTLTELICNQNPLTTLPTLPPSLTYIRCFACNITSLPILPASLSYLDCFTNYLDSLPNLPSALTHLDCHNNLLSSLPTLPSSITYLDCSYNDSINALGSLPTSLIRLHCNNCNLLSLPSLPLTLTYLHCRTNQLPVLPSLPSNLDTLYCGTNLLTSIPVLPSTLIWFDCSGNQISFIPPLTHAVKYFECSRNQLSSLPTLDSSLITLSCNQNLLTSIPTPPTSLTYLDCSSNQLSALPILPNTLTSLICNTNQITSIPNFPDSLANSNIGNNPTLSCLPEIKYMNFLMWGNTNIHCRPNIGNIITSAPLIDTLHLCQLSDTCPNYNCHSSFTLYPDTAILHHYFISDLSSAQPPLTYYWSWGDSTHDTIPLPSHVYADSGFYDVCLTITDATGCTSTHCDTSFHAMRSLNQMVYVDVVSSVTGIKDVSKAMEIKLYPNPTRGEFTIINLQTASARVDIYNILGVKVYSTAIIGKQETINKRFSSGVYIVKVTDGAKQFTAKLIVQ